MRGEMFAHRLRYLIAMDFAAACGELRTSWSAVVAVELLVSCRSAALIWLESLITTASSRIAVPLASAERSGVKVTARGRRGSTGPAGFCHSVAPAALQPSGSDAGGVPDVAALTSTVHSPPSATTPLAGNAW